MCLITGQMRARYPITGEVNLDHLIREVSATFPCYKVTFILGRHFDSVEYCLSL